MKVTLIKYPSQDDLMWCKTCCLNTVGKSSTQYPTKDWIEKLVKAEHSPIRELWFGIKMEIPYWVEMIKRGSPLFLRLSNKYDRYHMVRFVLRLLWMEVLYGMIL